MYFVSTREDMHRLAQKIAEMDPGIMTADFGEFSPGIRQSLLAIREGVPLASAKRELDKL